MKKLEIIFLFAVILGMSSQFHCLAQTQFNVHGYLSQAYARSNGHQIFGVPKRGTSDYRSLALQFRFDANLKSTIIIQLSHKRMGESPVMKVEDDIELDWAFCNYKFNESHSIKIGKIQLPLGIYNEIRDVGVLLPFYRVPYAQYGEGNYMSETIDGFSYTYLLNKLSPWSLKFDLYAGQWTWTEWALITNPYTNENMQVVETAKIDDALGVQFWCDSPLEGLRLGFGGYRGDVSGGLTFSENGWVGAEELAALSFSLDATFEKYFLRSEYTRILLRKNDAQAYLYYTQAGFHLTDKLSVNGQHGVFRIKDAPSKTLNRKVDVPFFKDYAISLKYDVVSSFVLKLEMHWNESFFMEDEPVLDTTIQNPGKTQYAIFSVSTSF